MKKGHERVVVVGDFLALTLISVVPILIMRIAADPFDVVKGTAVWILGLPLFCLVMYHFVTNGRRADRVFAVVTGLFLVAAAVSTAISPFPVISLFGQYQRYTGLLTIAFVCGLALWIADQVRRNGSTVIAIALVGSSFIVAAYGLIQEFDADPLTWGSTSFNKLVFSTLGNPNSASAWTSVVIPLQIGLLIHFKRSLALRLALSGLLGASVFTLSAYISFQGQLAVLSSVGLVFWYDRQYRHSSKTRAVLFGILILTVAIPQLDSSVGLFVISVLGFSSLGFLFSGEARKTVDPGGFSFWFPWLSVVSAASIFVFALRDRFVASIADGFVERGDFYRSARDMFLDRPIFGKGLETFGLFYTEFRPESHAVTLETSRSSSAHNVFLGMFATGGIVLGLCFVLYFMVVANKSLAVVMKARTADVLSISFVASFVSSFVILVVSVEHVALYVLFFTIWGVVVGLSTEPLSRGARSTNRSSRSFTMPRRRTPGLAVSLIAVSLGLVLLVIGYREVSRPLRAANASFQAINTYSTGNFVGAEKLLRSAVDTAPWEPLYSLQLSVLLSETGQRSEASDLAQRAADRSNYSPSFAITLAAVLFDAGNTDKALEVVELSVASDPYAPDLKRKAAQLYLLAAERFLGEGNNDAASESLQRASELDDSTLDEFPRDLSEIIGS